MHASAYAFASLPASALRRALRRRGLLAGLGAALAVTACSRPAPPLEQRVVAVAKVERTLLANSMTLQAEFEPYQDVQIHGKVAGFVNLIRVDLGDRVKTGDLIATLEVPELGAQLEAAVAARQRAQSDQQLAHLDSARLQAVDRSQPSLVAQQDLDTAAAKDKASVAALASAQAEADRYAALVAYTRITAPFNGIVTKRFVDVGSLVQAGTSGPSAPLIELAQDDLMRLRFPVPEAETPSIHAGEVVGVEVDAVHRKFSGKIVRASGEINRSTRTMVTEIDLPNPDGSLKAGMYASIILPLEEAPHVLAIPLQALSVGEHPTVMVVGPDGAVAERLVVIGLRTANRAEIKAGLSEGEQVVVSDRGGLHTGDRVIAKETEAVSLNQ